MPINHALEGSSTIDLKEFTALSESVVVTRPDLSPGAHGQIAQVHLDGSLGRLRDRHNASAIEPANDYEAVQTWLKLKKSAVTVKLYEREITRLIAWCVQVRGRPMSSLSIDDALAYRNFLTAIPANIIVKKGSNKRIRNAQADSSDTRSIPVPSFTILALSAVSIKNRCLSSAAFKAG